MNTKKNKNKNRPNKLPNPVPPQSSEKDAPVSEKSESFPSSPVAEKTEIILKPEKRVPEILSQAKIIPDVKNEIENDSPKKPKRNRAKKKKSDKEEGDNIEAEEIQSCSAIKDNKKSEIEQETHSEQNPPVALTSRKKKGKNKGNEASETNTNVQKDVSKPIEGKTECEGAIDISSETMGQEMKQAKKKNKKNKKNRTDSEKSDKAEEVSCTSAFKKILVPKDETESKPKETLIIEEAKDSTVSDGNFSEPTIKQVEKIFEEAVVIKESDKKIDDDVQKIKKKNKKDKKQQQKEEYLQDIKIVELEVVTLQEDKPVESIFFSENQSGQKQETEFSEKDNITILSECTLEKDALGVKESSPKPKAKIAKPVDKKGKGKHHGFVEDQSEKSNTSVKIAEMPILPDFITQPTSRETSEACSNILISTEMTTSSTPSRDLTSKSNVLELEIKSPTFDDSSNIKDEAKDSKFKDRKLMAEVVLSTDDQTITFEKAKPRQKKGKEKTNIAKEQPKIKDLDENVAPESEKVFDPTITQETYIESSDSPTITEISKKEENIQVLVHDPITLPDKSEVINSGPVENISVPDAMGMKRKKSPKPPMKSEDVQAPNKDDDDIMILPITEDITPEVAVDTAPKTIGIGPVNDTKEIHETKEETAQISGSDLTTPDLIEYPRCTSAQIIDGNNNTVIEEINTSDTSLFVPIVIPDTPLIQGSGETPTPDVVTSEIKIPERSSPSKSPRESKEKTDLKSKVMEVNKDMEELRLSIERSLAEFTQLEKENKELEKKLDTPVGSIEKLDDPAIFTHETVTESITEYLLETKNIKEECPKETVTKVTDEAVQLEITKGQILTLNEPPVCPARKDNKGKGKSKKKGKQENQQQTVSVTENITRESMDSAETKKNEKAEEKHDTKSSEQGKEKQQSDSTENFQNTEQKSEDVNAPQKDCVSPELTPIENFEDAMTSSADDVNKTFEIIADEVMHDNIMEKMVTLPNNPEINITEPDENDKSKEEKQQRENPLVSQPKNLLGHPEIPVRSNKTDYKKEKNKTPNTKLARVKIKDSVEIEKETKGIKHSKECQTENKPKFLKNKSIHESVTCVTSENDEYVYKYSFRKVFLSSNCHVCKKELKNLRVPCSFCNLVFYCSQKHKDEDYPQHQALCFAVSTISHLKGQQHIYADAQGVTGHNYRLLRMQMIVSCEKLLKRKLAAWEQEALLYPRMCADTGCREWRQGKLIDCDQCGQISFCKDHPDHFPKTHARWCKSYSLYQKLVVYQLTQGRLEPKLPGRLLGCDRISDNINRLLADMYDEKIDMTDMQYAALTQLATAPLTAAYCYQLYHDRMKSISNNRLNKTTTFTIHVVGAELQFEADSLNKWETFFLHLKPDVLELRVVLVGPELNPSNLPLELLGKIKLCPTCRVDRRRISFSFQDKQLYHEYVVDDDFLKPDIVCAFNPSINRLSSYNDTWSSTITSIFKLKVPFLITSYTMNELQRDLSTVKNSAKLDFNLISEAKYNPFASVRPDRNFITDDEIPLLFKNYCYMVLIGAF